MKKTRWVYLLTGAAGALLTGLLLAISVACAAAEPTPTPVPPAAPAPPAAPTAAPAPTATPIAATPTPVSALPTPTRVLPTPTPVVTGKPQYGGTLRYAASDLRDTLDPHRTVSSPTYKVLWAIYDQLVHLDEKGELIPELAERWNISPDGKTITFYLRKGVKFHDGSPLNAQAVKWNFDRMMDPNENSPRRAELAPYVQRVEAIDDLSLKIQLFAPLRPFLATLGSDRLGFIVSPTTVQKYGKDYGRNPVGTGAFTFAEWVIETRWVVKRNANYWDKGKPYLDAVIFQPAPDKSVMLALLRTGEVDMIEAPLPGDLPIIAANPDLKLGRLPDFRITALHFNPSKPPFDNRALRQAIAYAVDGETFAQVAYPGTGRRVYTLERLGVAYNPDLKPIVFNLKKAREKLAEAGYSSGIIVPAGCSAISDSIAQCEIIQAMLAEVGIKASVRLILPTDMYIPRGGFYVEVGFGPVTGMARRIDPHINLQRYFHSKGGNNYGGGYNNPEVDRLIEEAATVYDTAKARQLYSRIQAIVVGEDTVHVPYTAYDEFYPHHRTVNGFIPRVHGWTIVRELWISK